MTDQPNPCEGKLTVSIHDFKWWSHRVWGAPSKTIHVEGDLGFIARKRMADTRHAPRGEAK